MNSRFEITRPHQATFRLEPWSRGSTVSHSHVGQPNLEEKLVRDDRAGLRPAQMVENKLSGMLKGAFSLVSQMRLIDMIRRGSGS